MSVDRSSGASGASAASRRARYGLQSLVLVFAVTTCCVLAGLIADRFPLRRDVTATREHALSPRTMELLSGLTGEYELIVAANFADLEPAAARRTAEVMDNFARSSTKVKPTLIDISSPAGISDLDAIMGRLIERYRSALDNQSAGATMAVQGATEVSASLSRLSQELSSIRESVKDADPNAAALRRFLEDSGAVCRVGAQDLDRAIQQAGKLAGTTIGRTGVPATQDAIALLRKPIGDALGQLRQINDGLDALADAKDAAVSAATRGAVGPAAKSAAQLRDALARALTSIDELPTTPLASVARVLASKSTAIIVGPPGSTRGGVTSFDVSTLFPVRAIGVGVET